MFPTPPNVQSEWFWSNYRKGMEWMKKHEAAFWKSQALSLAEENKKLLQIIHDSNIRQPQTGKPKSTMRKKKTKPGKKKRRRRLSSKRLATNDNVEVSKELVEFFKISINHKEQLKKEKELREENAAQFVPPQQAADDRLKEMVELYGEESSKILGMETAMQLGYERYIDHKSPEYWPAFPLKK